MKRYIWTNFYVDTLRNLYLSTESEHVKQRERERFVELLTLKHGSEDIQDKVERYLSFKTPDLIVVNEFQPMLIEVQDA
jgi:hypothetical protein